MWIQVMTTTTTTMIMMMMMMMLIEVEAVANICFFMVCVVAVVVAAAAVIPKSRAGPPPCGSKVSRGRSRASPGWCPTRGSKNGRSSTGCSSESLPLIDGITNHELIKLIIITN